MKNRLSILIIYMLIQATSLFSQPMLYRNVTLPAVETYVGKFSDSTGTNYGSGTYAVGKEFPYNFDSSATAIYRASFLVV